MREHEAGRSRTPWRWHPWFKRIFNAVTHLSAATLLAEGMASSLAARKHKSRNDDRGGRDHAERDRDGGGNDRNREDKRESDSKEDRRHQRENSDRSDGDGHGGRNRNDKQESQADETSDAKSLESQQSTTPTPTPTSGDGGGRNDGGGGRGDGGGGRGDGGGNDAGNAGSGLFDSPLATKARRRANDFDNADRDEDEGRIVVDVDPEGESIYETDSILFATGPDGLEIETGNITYFAEPTPTPEPLPGLEMPEREPGYPFGEDFPFGDFPFGDATVTTGPTAPPEPTDPGDTAPAPVRRADPVPAADEPVPASTDGGDNTMDFTS